MPCSENPAVIMDTLKGTIHIKKSVHSKPFHSYEDIVTTCFPLFKGP